MTFYSDQTSAAYILIRGFFFNEHSVNCRREKWERDALNAPTGKINVLSCVKWNLKFTTQNGNCCVSCFLIFDRFYLVTVNYHWLHWVCQTLIELDFSKFNCLELCLYAMDFVIGQNNCHFITNTTY